MSGILGLIALGTSTPDLKLGARALVQIPGSETTFFAPCSGVALAAVGLKGRIETIRDDASGLLVMVQGAALSPVKPYRRLSATEILESYRRDELKSWEDLEGSFIIVLIDKGQRRLHIVNDRLGQLPLLYAQGPGWFCFGSQAKAIFPVTDLEPKLSIEGVVQFLTAGYPFGKRAMLEGISVLEPATQLSLGLDDLRLNAMRYWSLQYEPRRITSREKAMADLHVAVLEGHRIILGQGAPEYDLMLTGGWDSRGILEAMEQLGSRPQTARSWGVRDDLKGSDPEIARCLASAFDTDFHFFPYDVERLPRILRPWVCVSELMNDNLGWYIELPQCYGELHRPEAEFELLGDEIWGWVGHVNDERDAISRVLPPTLPYSVRKVFRQERLDKFRVDYEGAIRSILSGCVSRNPNDLKDFIYLNIRVNRFIFSLGYFRELMVPQRRPFLTRTVLDVICQIPREMRTDKNGYIAMLKSHMPKAASFPRTSTDSVADWPYLFRTDQNIRETFMRLLTPERVSQGVLGEILDCKQLSEIRDRFFAAQAQKRHQESPLKIQLRGQLRKLIERAPGLRRLVRFVRGNEGSDFDTLRRVALCVALQEELPRFKAGLPELLLFDSVPVSAPENRLRKISRR
ncbi:MAG TPA: hypothetical protein PKK23_06710 [Nitrospirales bacterium]|nr:hypothetical protein [Nitrospiraceae bacterium]HNP28716.1 hypothetical protein [Nitrospirales bacterium]